ncbi:MAG TPA: DUF2510 domain-containing protein [Acidimicrobiales bacterium]|nr:DUF2510 domain-containing protein [Acidimicrobiales bacterium]
MILAALAAGPAVLLLALASLVLAIYVIIDMAKRPSWQWERAGSNKVLWLVLEVLLLLLFGLLSVIVGLLYLVMTRPKLVAAERQGQSPGPASAGTPWPPGTQAPALYAPPVEAGDGPPPYPSTPGDDSPGAGGQEAPGPSSSPGFGWYADPSGRHQLRYWDGTAWTEHVSDAGQQSNDPLPG